MEVDDDVAGLPAAVEQLVHRRDRLHRPLERPDRERGAAREDERPHRATAPPHRADDDGQQEPERSEHRDPGAHDQERMERRRLLRLRRRHPLRDDEAPFVEAKIERRAVERE